MRIPYKNSVRFAGFIGNDVEVRKLPGSGDAVCSLRVASKHSWRDAKDGWQESTEWATAIFYRQDAVDVANACAKGDFIDFEARKFTRTWTDGEAHKKRAEELIVTSWHKVDLGAVTKRPAGEPSGEGSENPTASSRPKPAASRAQQTRPTSFDYSR